MMLVDCAMIRIGIDLFNSASLTIKDGNGRYLRRLFFQKEFYANY